MLGRPKKLVLNREQKAGDLENGAAEFAHLSQQLAARIAGKKQPTTPQPKHTSKPKKPATPQSQPTSSSDDVSDVNTTQQQQPFSWLSRFSQQEKEKQRYAEEQRLKSEQQVQQFVGSAQSQLNKAKASTDPEETAGALQDIVNQGYITAQAMLLSRMVGSNAAGDMEKRVEIFNKCKDKFKKKAPVLQKTEKGCCQSIFCYFCDKENPEKKPLLEEAPPNQYMK